MSNSKSPDEIEKGMNVIIRFHAGWKMRGKVSSVDKSSILVFDPELEEKIRIPLHEISEVYDPHDKD